LLFFVVIRFGLPAAGDQTLPALFTLLPPWLAVLPILSLLSALLSSANSVLLTAATTFQHDLWPAFQRRRLLTLFLGVCGAALAWAAPSLLVLFTKSYGFFAVAVSTPALLAFLPWRPHRTWVIAGMIGGGLLALWLPLIPALGLAVVFHFIGLLIRE
jgi:Na+/proline symporter